MVHSVKKKLTDELTEHFLLYLNLLDDHLTSSSKPA